MVGTEHYAALGRTHDEQASLSADSEAHQLCCSRDTRSTDTSCIRSFDPARAQSLLSLRKRANCAYNTLVPPAIASCCRRFHSFEQNALPAVKQDHFHYEVEQPSNFSARNQ